MKWYSEALPVLVAGAVGGIAGVLAAFVLQQPFPGGPYWAFGAAPLLGALAAFAGVFLLANSDRTDKLRCLAFAAICGFVWKPSLDAASALVTVRANREVADNATDKLSAITEELPRLRAKPQQAAEEINRAARLATEAAAAARTSDNKATRDAVLLQLKSLERAAGSFEGSLHDKALMDIRAAKEMLK